MLRGLGAGDPVAPWVGNHPDLTRALGPGWGRRDAGGRRGGAAARELARDLPAFCRGRLADVECPGAIDLRAELPRHGTGRRDKLHEEEDARRWYALPMRTGLVWHERYMWHNTGQASGPFLSDASGWLQPDWRHMENPESKRRIRSLLDVTGLLDQLARIDPRPATEEELLRFHTPEHVDNVRALSAGAGGEGIDGSTVIGKGSYEVALLSAGGVIAAVDAVLDGEVDNAYALVRPPGHHALPDAAMGFCLFGNAAVAVHHARQARGLERVAIVDWDVHHGNGTQAAFYDDPSVLTISLHQDNCFPPGSGAVEERGEGPGEGYNLNVPLPPGSGDGAYLAAFDRIVLPALERFAPELLLVASGLDASAMDPLGRMMVSPAGYAELTDRVLDAAGRSCDGRLVMSHEGGYSAELAPFCALAILERMSGIETEARDTVLQVFPRGMGQQELQPHQAALIDRVAALVPAIA